VKNLTVSFTKKKNNKKLRGKDKKASSEKRSLLKKMAISTCAISITHSNPLWFKLRQLKSETDRPEHLKTAKFKRI